MVSAIGTPDAFAVSVLCRAGFQETGVFSERWHRLPFDLGEETENAMACHATAMLIATGYEVELDPQLYRDGQQPDGVRPYAGAPGLALARLTEQLAGEPDEDMQRLQRFVLEPTRGVPDQISTLLIAAADRTDDWESGRTATLAPRFRTAARLAAQVGATLDDLLTTPDPSDERYAVYAADPRLALARHTEWISTTKSPRTAAVLLQRAVLERHSGSLDQLQAFLQTTAARCTQYDPDSGHTALGRTDAKTNALRAGESARSAAQLLPQIRDTLADGITVLGRLQPVLRSAAARSSRCPPVPAAEPSAPPAVSPDRSRDRRR
ncbi:hypothetical protein [Streptacidiphilus sp. MAP5-52]|uniref:hypothetical protein n=1 Tax=Streptacidiphilus sp. MAP5-52 TaxID=3156267 RepID=UPI00351232A7